MTNMRYGFAAHSYSVYNLPPDWQFEKNTVCNWRQIHFWEFGRFGEHSYSVYNLPPDWQINQAGYLLLLILILNSGKNYLLISLTRNIFQLHLKTQSVEKSQTNATNMTLHPHRHINQAGYHSASFWYSIPDRIIFSSVWLRNFSTLQIKSVGQDLRMR